MISRDLIALLEAAEVGSRELDDAIWAITHGYEFRWRVGARPEHLIPACYCAEFNNRHKDGESHWRSFGLGEGGPHYTTSLDAALTLVPEGWVWSVFSNWHLLAPELADTFGAVVEIVTSKKQVDGKPTAPLALCIAALRAREDKTP